MKSLNYLIAILFTVVLRLFAVDTIPGKCLEFDGSNDYVSGSGINTSMTAVTIEAWVNQNELTAGDIQRYVTVKPEVAVLRYDGASGTNQLHFYIKKANGSSYDIRINNILSAGGWFHVAGTYDGTTMKLYFNGRLMKTAVPAGGLYASDGNFTLSHSTETLAGKLDEVRIWNTARTADEIRKNMHLALSGTESGLLNNWQFNEGSGTALSDAVGGANGTLYNMDDSDWIASTVPFGTGSSDLKIISTAGSYDFTGTGVSMNVTSKTGTDTLVVSKINLPPNSLPVEKDETYDSQYWVINSFGGGSTTADISYIPKEYFESGYETYPGLIKLFVRSSNSDTSWVYLKDASYVNTSANTVEFTGISGFGQFIVSREYLPSITFPKIPVEFACVTQSFNGIDAGDNSNPVFTDLDGDGLLDMLIGEKNGNINHYEQSSPNSTSFTLVTESFNEISIYYFSAPSFTDLDGDGLLDMLIGERDGNINHYEQSSPNSTSFTLVTELFSGIDIGDFSTPAFTDLDGDGLLDMLVGEDSGCIYHYEQSSPNSTSFIPSGLFNGIDVGTLSAPSFTDLDGDGLLDMIVCEYDGNINHYEQNSANSTSFTLITESLSGINPGVYSALAFTDLDSDGHLDMIVGEGDGNINHYEQTDISEIEFGNIPLGESSVKSYYINAQNLESDLNLTVSSEFKISLSENTGYSNSLSITPEDRSISDSIFVKFTPLEETDYTGQITHTAVNSETKYIDLTGSNASISSVPGNALEFDGNNDYVTIEDNSSLDLTNNYTIEAWIRPSAFASMGGIVSKYHTAGMNGYFLRLSNSSPYTGIAFDGLSTSNGILEADMWYHIAAVNDNGTRHLYVNGKETALAGTPMTVVSNSDPLRIGVDFLASPRYFIGRIDEVRIWNSVRNAQEIRESMNSPLIGTETGLVSYWQFKEGSGTTARDVVNKNYGTLSNMDDADWVNSTIPFGSGGLSSKIISTTGSVDFTGTGFVMDFTEKTGTDTIIVKQLNLTPNIDPAGNVSSFNSQYWVVHKFGTGTLSSEFSITVSEDLTAEDESNFERIVLYSRTISSDNSWTLQRYSVQVDAVTNTAGFKGLANFGQFIIAKELPNIKLINNPSEFVAVTESFNGINIGNNSTPAFTDLDGDGLLDILIGEYDGNINHYEQSSANSVSFALVTASFNGIDVGSYSTPTITDLDSDGLFDMLIGEYDGNINHYEQSFANSVSFSLVTQSFNGIDVGSNSTPSITDLDNNGLVEMLVGENSGNINHYKQNSPNSTSFTLITESFNGIDVGSYSAPAITDIDNDGLQDMLVGEYAGNINHYEQAGISEISFGNTLLGNSPVKNYFVKAKYMESDLNLTVSSEFKISLSENTGYSNSLSIIPVDGKVADSVFVKFSPPEETDYADQISHSSVNCETKYLDLTGRGVNTSNIPGRSLAFDGINDYTTIADNISLDLTNNYTIEAWIKPSGFAAMAGIVSKYQTAGTNGYFLRLSSTVPYTGLTFDGLSTSNGILEADMWYHIAAVNDNGTRHLYVNGKETALAGTPTTINSNSDPLRIGVDFLANPRYFNGKIDEVRLWNTARSIQDIRQKMNSPLVGTETGLVSYWQLNEGSGTTVNDMISNNNGTLTNMDDTDWVNSTIPFGSGHVNSQIVSTTGIVDFTDTGIIMDFKEKSDTDTLVVTIINLSPNITPAEPDSTFNSQYWVVHKFGTGTLSADISLTTNKDLTGDDASNPTRIKLYARTVTSDSSWTYNVSSAQVDSVSNTATFPGITGFSQLIIGKGDMDVPKNVTTEIVGSEIKISWDSVPGAVSYKVYASDDPYGIFEDVSVLGIFDGTSWTIAYADSKKFYYVVAVSGTKYFDKPNR